MGTACVWYHLAIRYRGDSAIYGDAAFSREKQRIVALTLRGMNNNKTINKHSLKGERIQQPVGLNQIKININ